MRRRYRSASTTKVGEWEASGLLFKDTVQVLAVDDPKIAGVTFCARAHATPAAS